MKLTLQCTAACKLGHATAIGSSSSLQVLCFVVHVIFVAATPPPPLFQKILLFFEFFLYMADMPQKQKAHRFVPCRFHSCDFPFCFFFLFFSWRSFSYYLHLPPSPPLPSYLKKMEGERRGGGRGSPSRLGAGSTRCSHDRRRALVLK